MRIAKSTQQGTTPEDLLESCGDLLLEMEGAMECFEILYTDIGNAMDDIRDEMEGLREHLAACHAALQAYRSRNKIHRELSEYIH